MRSDQPSSVVVNVHTAPQAPVLPTVLVVRNKAGLMTQFLWFCFVGFWASAAAVILAYLCILTVLGIPLGIAILNKIPKIIALREPGPRLSFLDVPVQQRNFFLRALWFVFVGSWFTFVWLSIGYLFCLIILGLPLGLWMFDKAPAILTLRRSPHPAM